MSAAAKVRSVFNTTVVVSALGYFVDIYDLVLFTIVRVASLKDLQVSEEKLMEVGVHLLNLQMTGMLLGGILWGVLGDRLGRLSVLFGSILIYSLANIANAFVTNTETYGLLRFIAGIGLAGELGAAITLVSETLPKHLRGYGTSLVAGIGVSGAILAAVIGKYFSWQTAYIVGGVMGLVLLITRIKMFESGLFQQTKKTHNVKRGDLILLFSSPERIFRYLCCILIGLPLWYVIGILVTFCPEIGRELGATGVLSAGSGILFSYGGLVVGDLGSGLISQLLQSRRKAVMLFLVTTLVFVLLFLFSEGQSPSYYYFVCFLLGIGAGYWAMFVTVAAEQFGTNLRATVATTAPNFVRGSVVVLTASLQYLRGDFGLVGSALVVGVISIGIAMLATFFLQESFHRDMDFVEK